MIKLKWLDEKCLELFQRLDTKKWTLAHDRGHRYGWMSINIIECINGLLKGVRMLPITTLVQLTFYRYASYFETHHVKIRTQIANGDLYTFYAINKKTKYESRAGEHTMQSFTIEIRYLKWQLLPVGFIWIKETIYKLWSWKKEHVLVINDNSLVSHVHKCYLYVHVQGLIIGNLLTNIIGWMYIVVIIHHNLIIFHINPVGYNLIFQLSILILFYYVIKGYQDLQGSRMKWSREN